jgi:hypothetical protein
MAEVGFVKFATVALRVGQAALPAYRSKFSKCQFTQPQLLAILCLMRYEDWTFLRTCSVGTLAGVGGDRPFSQWGSVSCPEPDPMECPVPCPAGDPPGPGDGPGGDGRGRAGVAGGRAVRLAGLLRAKQA